MDAVDQKAASEREQEVEYRMRMLGISRMHAEFITAIEHGEIDGDVVMVEPKPEGSAS